MEIHNVGTKIVNCYVYAIPDGYVMIDTGYEDGLENVEKKLKKRSIELSEIKYLFLTHSHDDHAGFLNELLGKNKDLKVIVSRLAIQHLKRGHNSPEGGCSSRAVKISAKFLELFGKKGQSYPAIAEQYDDRFIVVTEQNKKDLEELLQGKILFTPGHTADSICLKVDDVIFCGDAATNGYPSKHRISIWLSNPAQYEKSWEILISESASMIYPGHGNPFPTIDLERYKKHISKVKIYPLS